MTHGGMRGDPERFTTFVLGTFMLVYYVGLALQTVRVWRHIGRPPIVAGATLMARLWVVAGTLWPLVVLGWAWCPACFADVPRLRGLEHWPFRLLGLLSLCAGAALVYSAYVELGDHWRIGAEAVPTGFVRSGIYGSIRHPVYTGIWLALWGTFLMAPNLLFAVLGAAGGTALSAEADHEDALMTAALGKPFRDYMLNTGKFFPLWY